MEQHNSSINEIDDEKTSLLTNNKSTKRNNNNNQGISWYFAVFLIVNAALGAGLLNFAKAFDNAGGILAATLIHLV
jgi:sodium-coupled neutral amino acid transporter 7/8